MTHQYCEQDSTLLAPLSNCIHSPLWDTFFLFEQGCDIRLSGVSNPENILQHLYIFLPLNTLKNTDENIQTIIKHIDFNTSTIKMTVCVYKKTIGSVHFMKIPKL